MLSIGLTYPEALPCPLAAPEQVFLGCRSARRTRRRERHGLAGAWLAGSLLRGPVGQCDHVLASETGPPVVLTGAARGRHVMPALAAGHIPDAPHAGLGFVNIASGDDQLGLCGASVGVGCGHGLQPFLASCVFT